MSDCGVCVYADFDEAADVFSAKLILARKDHMCCECRRVIPKGTQYQQCDMLYEGSWEHFKTCTDCAEIGNAFCCDGRAMGMLWDGMYQVMSELTTSCYDRLVTASAKAYLRTRWMEWKGVSQ